ncbi:MAG TPA: hypothetical protein VGM95_01265 [Lactobacillaceae bacterium]
MRIQKMISRRGEFSPAQAPRAQKLDTSRLPLSHRIRDQDE